MADALRPSLDLFQESIPAAQRHSLPGYYGSVGSQTSNVMVAQARRLRTDRAARRPAMKSSPTANQYWRYVAFALAGFSLALVLRAVEIAEGETAARTAQQGAAQRK